MGNQNSFVCPICGNTDIHSIGILNGKLYCRRCISFKGEEVEHKHSYPKKAPIHLEYELSPEQKELSNKLVENYKKGIDSLVFAVCGSGKTEIVLNVIRYAIEKGEKVGFALPRRDVVIEIYGRFRNVFTSNSIVVVYGGNTKHLDGDLICLTTHQLFRYEKYYDLLIVDEIDAFPYDGNKVLNAFLKRSLKGRCVMLSATPSEETIKYFSKGNRAILRLNKRFHGYPLPVPRVIQKKKPFLHISYLLTIKNMISRSKQIFIFTPTIDICEKTFRLTSLFFKNGNYVHSKRQERIRIIDDFRKQKYMYLVTTAVLERGVTVKDLQVIVFLANHQIYDSHALIQISGRVGRKKEAPTGEIIYFCTENTLEIQTSIKEIRKANESL